MRLRHNIYDVDDDLTLQCMIYIYEPNNRNNFTLQRPPVYLRIIKMPRNHLVKYNVHHSILQHILEALHYYSFGVH